MIHLYRDRYSDPKANAQENLMGRTHYVDEGTLRFHKSRILEARAAAEGLLFLIFGNTVERASLDDSWLTKDGAAKALARWLPTFDARTHTLQAIASRAENDRRDLDRLGRDVLAMGAYRE